MRPPDLTLDGLRARLTAGPDFEKERRLVDVALGLIEMRKAGIFHAVHCDNFRFAVQGAAAPDVKRQLSFTWAERLVREYRAEQARLQASSKPAASDGRKRASMTGNKVR